MEYNRLHNLNKKKIGNYINDELNLKSLIKIYLIFFLEYFLKLQLVYHGDIPNEKLESIDEKIGEVNSIIDDFNSKKIKSEVFIKKLDPLLNFFSK
jgi:hypothetical protein